MAKKRRYFAKKKVLKAIAKYYRVTVSRINTLIGNANGTVTLAGLEQAYDISHILTGSSTFQQLGKQFALVKLRGILVEVNPCAHAIGGGMVCLAIQQADEQNNVGVYSQPNVIPVSEVQNTRKYIPINSGWEPTNALTTISNIKLAFQIIQNFNADKHWNVLVKLYFTFKSTI